MTGGDEAERLAERIVAASGALAPIPPITAALPGFDLGDAYRVSAAVTALRVARGERPVGWKIGFTNRTIWDEYGVRAPIWGPMYDTTLAAVLPGGPVPCPLGALMEPRIEPEIAFRFARAPHPDMEEGELVACLDAVAHGIEIVQSVFPAWRFAAPDTVAAFALHGCYRCGPLVPIGAADRAEWRVRLSDFEIRLDRDGEEIDRGHARNVLGGPLQALAHFVRGRAAYPDAAPLAPGAIVTTGTVTRAFPVRPGERWRTQVDGLPLPGLELAFV